MARFVLTLVGADRSGLVAAVAERVRTHSGNWESSQLAEIAGVFAGVVQITVPDAQAADLLDALGAMDGLAITTHEGSDDPPARVDDRVVALTVLGNDRPGIIGEVTAVLGTHRVNIDRMTTEVRDASMSGGSLFEASVTAHVPAAVDVEALRDDLERIASEVQVDIAFAAPA
ncbi:glycine cleavage system protein R [Microbacterium sp. P01]|uniref:glycine cleavage system protein R n=1 Tax=unclassified Microbacterium TaxID=2609290 RepID=UPI00366F3CB6